MANIYNFVIKNQTLQFFDHFIPTTPKSHQVDSAHSHWIPGAVSSPQQRCDMFDSDVGDVWREQKPPETFRQESIPMIFW